MMVSCVRFMGSHHACSNKLLVHTDPGRKDGANGYWMTALAAMVWSIPSSRTVFICGCVWIRCPRLWAASITVQRLVGIGSNLSWNVSHCTVFVSGLSGCWVCPEAHSTRATTGTNCSDYRTTPWTKILWINLLSIIMFLAKMSQFINKHRRLRERIHS